MMKHPAGALGKELDDLLRALADGLEEPASCSRKIRDLVVRDLGYAQVDLHRQHRRGRAEAVFCEGKSTEQVTGIARAMLEAGQNVLLTRMSPEMMTVVGEEFALYRVERSELAGLMHVQIREVPRKVGFVGVVCAGTTDMPVAEEAAMTAEALGSPVERIYDVGVAGLHRLLRHCETLDAARVLIVVAGMEGALPSVVGGLARAPVIAVPTSVGYGAAFGGVAALLGMLNSCAPGLSVVNIDNGFGAGYLADVINEIGEPKQD